ncbi:MAG: methyltransferase dimerization domain-containing protein, partial [Pseudomonadota bacterium]
MTDIGHHEPPGLLERLTEWFHEWRLNKVASPDFQRWAATSWFTRAFAKRDSERVYDLVAGFVYSQTLLACTELGVLSTLQRGPASARLLAMRHGLPEDRMSALCQAAASVGLMARRRDGSYRLGRLGAAVIGVPGLEQMIRHHKVFYRDISDPVALLRGETDPELSHFWPYVMGADRAANAETAAEYSALMATSQVLVA